MRAEDICRPPQRNLYATARRRSAQAFLWILSRPPAKDRWIISPRPYLHFTSRLYGLQYTPTIRLLAYFYPTAKTSLEFCPLLIRSPATKFHQFVYIWWSGRLCENWQFAFHESHKSLVCGPAFTSSRSVITRSQSLLAFILRHIPLKQRQF